MSKITIKNPQSAIGNRPAGNHQPSTINHQPSVPEWKTLPPLVVPAARKAAWKWAMRTRAGWRLEEFMEAAGDALVREIARESRERKKPVPQWVNEWIAEQMARIEDRG